MRSSRISCSATSAIGDFKAELITERDLDVLLLSIEVRRGVDAGGGGRAEGRGA